MVKENKKTEDIKAYQAAYRKEHPKNKEATNEYMKKYIANAPDVHCPICQGHFKTYAKYKHDRSKKHLKALIDIKDKEEKAAAKKAEDEAVEKAKQEAEAKATTTATATAEASKTTKRPPKPTRPVPQPKKKREKSALEALQEYESSSEEEEEKKEVPTTKTAISFKLPNKKIDPEDVTKYLVEHFEGSADPNRPAATKTPRVNKYLTVWNKVLKTVIEIMKIKNSTSSISGLSWKYIGEHFQKIISEAYDKPSSQADAVQMLKMVFIHFCKLDIEDQKLISGVARKLKETHVKKQTEMPENGVTYAEMKEHENDENTTVALLMRLYSPDIPALRIYDWINAYVGNDKELNSIDMKKSVMIRRIKKNQGEATEDIIPLPKSLIDFIRKRGIKGPLLGDISAAEIDKMLKKTFPDKTANPRYFRDMYSTKITPTLTKDKLEKVLEIMDHSAEIHAKHYRKHKGDALTELIVGK